jgi:hypothetical protein
MHGVQFVPNQEDDFLSSDELVPGLDYAGSSQPISEPESFRNAPGLQGGSTEQDTEGSLAAPALKTPSRKRSMDDAQLDGGDDRAAKRAK